MITALPLLDFLAVDAPADQANDTWIDFKTAATLLITLLVALSGYGYSLYLARRRDRLERINLQLSQYYGPLYSLSQTGEYVWRSFRETHRPHKGNYWTQGPPVLESDAHAFRVWMSGVFMPQNRAMKDIIVHRADLLEETEMPQCLLDLCAHVSAYQALEKQWEQGNYYEHVPSVNFPRKALSKYSAEKYLKLKGEQARLLNNRPFPFKFGTRRRARR